MLTLWDFIEPVARLLRPAPPAILAPARPVRPAPPAQLTRPQAKRPKRPASRLATADQTPVSTAQERYDAVARAMLLQYGIKVRKWRSSMSGVAWITTYRDGSITRYLESPRPKGPMSAAVFLHEVGHHAIGFNVYKPRCLEEYHAWAWSLHTMQQHGLNITDSVRFRMAESLWYAVAKARRRGLKELPAELAPYIDRPKRPKKLDAA